MSDLKTAIPLADDRLPRLIRANAISTLNFPDADRLVTTATALASFLPSVPTTVQNTIQKQ
mgnify:CR=1 FL=1